ncbi:hypothetical protein LTR50_003169 [Elasticomyces elasticus]|nr:hypothetical protein LTR50_003169 [Elasticomyces elasticus]
MDNIIHEANTEIMGLRDKLSAVHLQQKNLEQKNHDLVEAFREKSKNQQQLQVLCQRLKAQAMTTQVQTAASDDAENTLQSVAGNRFIEKTSGGRDMRNSYSYFPEQIHSRQKSSSSAGNGTSGRRALSACDINDTGTRGGLHTARTSPSGKL